MTELRADLAIISQWIEPGSRVLDLGCGDGALLKYLQEHRQVSGYGLEIDPANVVACIRNKVDVIQTDLDAGLNDFDPDSFDYVVMTQTLQAVLYPHKLINEMLRIGRQGIVTFPNFGYWRPRLYLALKGRMPVSSALPHSWYDTPNIHLCTLRDFEALCRKQNIRILERHVLDHAHREQSFSRLVPNLLGEVAMYRFEKER
jgi:methionine biosynthesis protein MetW